VRLWLVARLPFPLAQAIILEQQLKNSSMDNKLRFFTHDRLDLVVKYRFFKALKNGTAAANDEEMYVKHILGRTGGVEPGRRHKTSVEMYLVAARALFHNMMVHGFNKRKPISVDQWGRLRDGAHRLACATLLGLDVPISYRAKEYPIRQWGIDWFLAKGFGKQYVNGLLDEVNIITHYSNPAASDPRPARRRP
jgi:hypothetical protein